MQFIENNGVYLTQNIDDLPIEERVFFRQGVGMNIDSGIYRVATPEELEEYALWQRAQADIIEALIEIPK